MTEDRKLQLASGQFLTRLIPDEFFEWESDKQDEFLERYATEVYECTDAGALWEMIEDTAAMITMVIEEQSSNTYLTM